MGRDKLIRGQAFQLTGAVVWPGYDRVHGARERQREQVWVLTTRVLIDGRRGDLPVAAPTQALRLRVRVSDAYELREKACGPPEPATAIRMIRAARQASAPFSTPQEDMGDVKGSEGEDYLQPVCGCMRAFESDECGSHLQL